MDSQGAQNLTLGILEHKQEDSLIIPPSGTVSKMNTNIPIIIPSDDILSDEDDDDEIEGEENEEDSETL